MAGYSMERSYDSEWDVYTFYAGSLKTPRVWRVSGDRYQYQFTEAYHSPVVAKQVINMHMEAPSVYELEWDVDYTYSGHSTTYIQGWRELDCGIDLFLETWMVSWLESFS